MTWREELDEMLAFRIATTECRERDVWRDIQRSLAVAVELPTAVEECAGLSEEALDLFGEDPTRINAFRYTCVTLAYRLLLKHNENETAGESVNRWLK